MKELKIQKNKIFNVLFIIVVFLLTRQVPFSSFSVVMNFSVLAMCILTLMTSQVLMREWKLVLFLLVIPLLFSLCYSILFTDNSLSNIIRFFTILLFLGLAYFINVGVWALRAFIWLCLLQVFVMIIIHLWISIFFDLSSYLPIRFFFLDMGWGDVYSYDGIFYRIQIKGSALLVLAFMLTIESNLFKRKYIIGFLLFIGIILAGNFAYLIALCFYFLYKLLRFKDYTDINRYLLFIFVTFVLGVLCFPYIYQYVSNVLAMKSEGSIGTRGDQFSLLLADLNQNFFTLFLGQGLGNTLNIVSSFRSYIGDIYFELQSIYILNQLGLLFFILYLLYNLLIVYNSWRYELAYVLPLYIFYIIYAFTNPYIFDTNHFVVIVILNSYVTLLKTKSTVVCSQNLSRQI